MTYNNSPTNPVYIGDTRNSSPHSALLNPDDFDFDNMSINKFTDIVDAIRTLESDMAHASGYSGSLRDTFWDDVMGVKGALDNANFSELDYRADDKIKISDFFAESVERTAKMEQENYRAFHGSHGIAQQKQQTVAKITSEPFLREYQEKAVAFLKTRETQLIDRQA
ncbi:hypothetical protein [Pseudoalteromonas sp. J010]|uniref:hypothetical protein n=1 Tax=Pseudoalteromonas sp. J010 TaxID=998465 RepID=UPI0023B89815|nr:hypothetical protein [Pseudoalteromonas sp. J010]